MVTRSRIGSYFEEKAKTVVMKIGVHHVVLDILLSKSFFDEIESLEKVNSAIVEVSTKKPKNTAVNDSFADLLETTSSINGNTAILTLKAKYSKNGLLGVSKWAKKIKENPSVTGIKIIGLKNGAEHIINFEKSSEKIPVEVLVNDEGIVQTLDMYDKMLTAILGRDFLQ